MTIELDHFFVITRPGAPEADSLAALGQPHLMELQFNYGAARQEKDLRPGLPLIICG